VVRDRYGRKTKGEGKDIWGRPHGKVEIYGGGPQGKAGMVIGIPGD